MDETSLQIMQLSAQGFCCSQIMMKLTLADMGEENVALVRAMAGLCEGSNSGGICGVASGGACIMALYAAKGSAGETTLDCYPLLLSDFIDWFKANASSWGGINCDDIIAYHGGVKPEVCGNMMVRAREMILQILTENNNDPSLPRNEAGDY
jgi:hypothetical protein